MGIIFVESSKQSINYTIFEMMEKKEILEEIENLKLIFEYHSAYKVIKDPIEFENHINAILDRISELKKMLESE